MINETNRFGKRRLEKWLGPRCYQHRTDTIETGCETCQAGNTNPVQGCGLTTRNAQGASIAGP